MDIVLGIVNVEAAQIYARVGDVTWANQLEWAARNMAQLAGPPRSSCSICSVLVPGAVQEPCTLCGSPLLPLAQNEGRQGAVTARLGRITDPDRMTVLASAAAHADKIVGPDDWLGVVSDAEYRGEPALIIANEWRLLAWTRSCDVIIDKQLDDIEVQHDRGVTRELCGLAILDSGAGTITQFDHVGPESWVIDLCDRLYPIVSDDDSVDSSDSQQPFAIADRSDLFGRNEGGEAEPGPIERWRAGAQLESAVEGALLYGAACAEVVTRLNAAGEEASTAVKARNKALEPMHPLSRETFERLAHEAQRKFVPLYKDFLEACSTARDIAAAFRAVRSTDDVERVLYYTLDGPAYAQTEVAGHLLRASFEPTPAAFLESIGATNAAIEADIYYFGNDGFIPHVYSPQASDEKACPWCAETIKAAARICRFCNREVDQPQNSI